MSSNKNRTLENDCISTAISCTYIFVYMYVNFILVFIHSVMLVFLTISLVRYLGVIGLLQLTITWYKIRLAGGQAHY